MLWQRWAVLAVLAALAILGLCMDLASGPAALPLAKVFHELIAPNTNGDALHLIVWEVRLPQALLAVLVGAALAVAGVELQTALDNPLASPFTLGAASAAAFGAALVIATGASVTFVPDGWLLPGSAFAFALANAMLIWGAARSLRGGTTRLVLLGIGLSYAFQALNAVLQYLASPTALQQIVFWTLGSLAQASWDRVGILFLVVAAVLPFGFRAAWRLTVLRLGDERARSFGVDTTWLRFGALLRASLLTAAAMAFVGTIGFIGLVGPHIARMVLGEDARFLLPGAALTGAVVMSLASVGSKLIIPGAVLPIGVLTAVIGLPVFFTLVFARRTSA